MKLSLISLLFLFSVGCRENKYPRRHIGGVDMIIDEKHAFDSVEYTAYVLLFNDTAIKNIYTDSLHLYWEGNTIVVEKKKWGYLNIGEHVHSPYDVHIYGFEHGFPKGIRVIPIIAEPVKSFLPIQVWIRILHDSLCSVWNERIMDSVRWEEFCDSINPIVETSRWGASDTVNYTTMDGHIFFTVFSKGYFKYYKP